jgi:hypothetical protein
MSADALRRKVSEALDGEGGLDAPAHAGLRAELAADEDAAEWARDAVRLDGLLRGWSVPERGEDFWEGLAARIEERVAADKGAPGPDLTAPPFFDDADVRAARLATQAGKGVEGLKALDAKRAAFSLDQLSDLGGTAPAPASVQPVPLAKGPAAAKSMTPAAAGAPVRAAVASVVAQPETIAASPVPPRAPARVEPPDSIVNRPAVMVSNPETMSAAVDVDVSVDDAPAADSATPMVGAGLSRTARPDVGPAAVVQAAPRPIATPAAPLRLDPRPPAPVRDDRVSLPSFRPPIAPLQPIADAAAPPSPRRGWMVGAVAALAAALVGVAVFVARGPAAPAAEQAAAVATSAPTSAVASASPAAEAAPPPSARQAVAALPPASPAAAPAPGPAPAATVGGQGEPPGSSTGDARPSRARGGARRSRAEADDFATGSAGGGAEPSASASAPAPRAVAAAAPESDEPLPETPERADVLTAMGAVRSAVAACAAGRGGVVTVRVTFAGSSGRVTTAVVEGAFAGTPEGSCMARAIRAARVPRFAQPTSSVSFPFQI